MMPWERSSASSLPSLSAAGSVPRAFSSRHFLKLIEDTGKVGFWSADLRSERLDASLGLYRILGLDPASEVTFCFGLDMIHPDDRAAHGDPIAVLRSGQPISREFRIIRPDRTQRWIRHLAEVILGPDGAPSQGMGVVFDVTERHDAMNALIAAPRPAQRPGRRHGIRLWVNNANGEPTEMPQWLALTGQTHAQLQGLGWLDAIHPDDRARDAGGLDDGGRAHRPPTTRITASCARTGSTAGSTPAAPPC